MRQHVHEHAAHRIDPHDALRGQVHEVQNLVVRGRLKRVGDVVGIRDRMNLGQIGHGRGPRIERRARVRHLYAQARYVGRPNRRREGIASRGSGYRAGIDAGMPYGPRSRQRGHLHQEEVTVQVEDESVAGGGVPRRRGSRVAGRDVADSDRAQRSRILERRGHAIGDPAACYRRAHRRVAGDRCDAEDVRPRQQAGFPIARSTRRHSGERGLIQDAPGRADPWAERYRDPVRVIEHGIDRPCSAPDNMKVRSAYHARQGPLNDASRRVRHRVVGLDIRDRHAGDCPRRLCDVRHLHGIGARAGRRRAGAAVRVRRVFSVAAGPPPRPVMRRVGRIAVRFAASE